MTSDLDVDGMATHVLGSTGLHHIGVEINQIVAFYVQCGWSRRVGEVVGEALYIASTILGWCSYPCTSVKLW